MGFYKILGALLLALSGVCGAYFANQRVTVALKQTEAWLSFLRYVRGQIDCYSLPARQILASVDLDLLRVCGYAEESPPESFAGLLRGCRISDGETERIVGSFAEEFGKSYREEQLRGCAYYCDLLAARRETLERQLPGRKKVNCALWISGTLAVVILLI